MTSSFPGTEPAPGLVVSTHLRTAAGSALPVEVTLTNNAAAPRVLTVGALGVDAAWLPAPVRTAALEPGQSIVVTLVLTPTQGTVPAHYPFAFTVQSLDPATGRPAGAAVVMVDSTLVVNPRNQLTLELRPRSVSTVSSRKVRLALRNSGHEAARVTLEVKTSPRVRVRFRTKAIEVLPGATELVRGRATVTHRRLFGGTEHHTYTVSASGTESLRHVEGSVTQHPLVGTVLMKAVALLSVLAIWIGAAVIFIPQLANRISDRSGETSTSTTVDGGKGDEGGTGEDGASGDGDGGSSESGGGSGDEKDQGDGKSGGKGDDKSGGKGGTQQAADTDDSVIALTGTVGGEQPGGVRVSLEPTSLVDEDAQGGVGVGVPSSQLGTNGKSSASSALNRAVSSTPRNRTSSTSADGSWAFAGVKKPGYYLLTFTKRGFQKQSFVIDSTSEASAEPLEVDLAAGQGTLSGTVTGPRGKVGAATVTITDGTNTITTSSNSRGQVGHWSVKGLSTPGAYVVQAVKPGFSSESRMVDLAAGGTATADLRLRSGVASLVGKVRTTNQSGELAGVGGATVTVTAEDGAERTATTLTQGSSVAGSKARVAADFVGTYTVPGLPAPGSYVVTLSGPGMQTQTSKVKLKPGQSQAGIDADLTPSSGAVAGTITGLATAGGAAGIVGAGLTLSNADNTYKTMSTSQPVGSFLFDGVTPGTYLLETSFFGYVSDHVTVTVKAGRTATANRQIVQVEGGVLAARSSVKGRAIDGGTSATVTCPDARPCLVATVHEPGVGEDADDDHTYKTTFLPGDEFTLPDPLTDPGGGLLPGLHKVTVTAPHYSSASATVQVGDDETVNVGTLELLPAPRVAGTLTTVVGTPQVPDPSAGAPAGSMVPANTCIWAVSGSGDAPDGCDVTQGDAAKCQQGDAIFDAGDTRVCAYVTGTGSYSIEVPQEGTYTLYVRSADPEYVEPAPASILLESGVTRNQPYTLNRLGRVSVTVRQTGSTGALVPVVDSVVSPTPGGGTPVQDDAKTNGAGAMQFHAVNPGTYTLHSDLDASITSTFSVGLNQDQPVRINVTKPIDAAIGQVTSSMDGATTYVGGASVRVTAPVGYGADDSITRETVEMTTTGQGCFLIEKSDSPSPVASAGGCAWTTAGTAPSRGRKTFISPVTSSIALEAPGYVDDTKTNVTLETGTDLNSFVMAPKPVPLGTVQPVLDPTAQAEPTFNWSQVAFSVAPVAGPTNAITVKATGTGTSGALSWTDSRIPGTTDVVTPGHYAITATRAGYLPDTKELNCPLAITTAVRCSWTAGAIKLTKLSSLKVTAKDGSTVVPGAAYTLSGGPAAPQTITAGADANGVTFTGLDPTVTSYQVRVRAAGYDFGSDDDPLAITCGGASSVVLQPGGQADCSVAMSKLGTIKGKVTGVPELPPITDPVTPIDPETVTDLGGATVTITECEVPDGDTCETTNDDNSFTGKAADDGTFTITGTASKQGLDLDKAWLVTAALDGYKMDGAGANPGVLVRFADGANLETADIQMLLKPVNAKVSLLLGTTSVSGAAVELRRLTAAGTATELVQNAGVSGSSYTFTNVVPGSYIVAYSGAGLRASTSDVLIKAAQAGVVPDPQTFSLPVARAVNVVHGTITASDGGAIKNATVWVCNTAACTGPAPGGDAVPMETHTDATGNFSVSMVPDGDYWVKITKAGYFSQTLGMFPFSPVLGPVSLNTTLQLVTRKVTVTINTPWDNNNLVADGMKASLTPEDTDGRTAYTNVDLVAAGSKTFTASFEQVKWGCWKFSLSKPARHFGVAGALSGGPTDTDVTCTGDKAVTVPKTDAAGAVTAALTLDEGRLDLGTTLAQYPGFAAADPGDVRVTVKRGSGDPIYDNDDFAVGSTPTTIWLPTGGAAYTVTAALKTPSAFWPAVSVDKSVPATQPSTEVAAALTLEEKAATLEVDVSGAPPSGSSSPGATLTLTPPTGVAVPPGYLPTVPTGADGKVSLKLPGGSWTVTATIPGDTEGGSKSLLLPQTYQLPITVVWAKATGATAGAPGSFTPATYATPANLAAMSGVTASPSTAWTTGQFVELGNGNNAYWDGAAWRAGKVPPPATGATAGKPGEFTPSGAVLPANLAALKAAIDLGSAAAWTKDQYVVLGDANNAYWDGTTWKAGKVP